MVKKLLKYQGSKWRFIDAINFEIDKVNATRYIEPFCGSASVFFNLKKEFKRGYILSDIDQYVIQIFNTFTKISFEQLYDFYYLNEKQYGNWGKSKQSFYAFRNAMNKQYFKTQSIEEGMFLYIINKSVINSIFRVGKNGCNSAFGNRGRSLALNNETFLFFKDKLMRATLLCQSYVFTIKQYADKDSLLFLDPPYNKTNSSYNGNDTLLFERDKFLQLISDLKSKIIYTDLYDEEVAKNLKWRVVELRELVSVRPHKSAGTKRGKEVMYCNF